MNLGAEGQAGVARLVYVASYPSAPHGDLPEPTEWLDDDALIRRLGDGTFVLDTDRWLEAESHLFDPAALEHLKQHRRRPVSLRVLTDPNPGAAWTTIPFTVLLGRHDPLIPVDEAVREITNLTIDTFHTRPDIRIIDSDHFIPFRNPDVVADLILEPLPFSN
jgi:pimeloyl-ACP methyl ester carboxylesterase